jgi:hypothetical protein
MPSLDDTTRCPVDDTCATCGSPTNLAVATAETAVGVFCVTLCGTCGDDGALPRGRSWPGAVHASLEHCGHLGIDADQMADLMEKERTET